MKLSGRTLIPLGIVGGMIFLLIKVQGILLPFVLAAALAYLLSPLVRFFEVRGIRRAPAVVLVYGGLLLVMSGGLFVLGPIAIEEANQAASQMPIYVAKGSAYLEELRTRADTPEPETLSAIDRLARRLLFNKKNLEALSHHGDALPQKILNEMPNYAANLLPAIEVLFLTPFLAFFFMMEAGTLRDRLLKLVPAKHVEMCLNILVEVDNSLGKYIRGVSLEATCVGFLAFVGFWLIGLDYALQIGILVGIANVMPYVGPVVGGILGAGVAIFQWGTLSGVLQVAMVCVAVRFIEDWFIQPFVLRHAVHLHPVLIVFALMSGAELFGFWGLLFAVPAACALQVLITVVWQWYMTEYRWHADTTPAHVARVPLI